MSTHGCLAVPIVVVTGAAASGRASALLPARHWALVAVSMQTLLPACKPVLVVLVVVTLGLAAPRAAAAPAAPTVRDPTDPMGPHGTPWDPTDPVWNASLVGVCKGR